MSKAKLFLLLIPVLLFIPDLSYSAGSCKPLVTANSCSVFDSEGDPQVIFASLCLVQANISEPLFNIFQNIANKVIGPAKLLMALYLMFYGFSFMFGFEGGNPKSFIMKIFKISLMILIISDVCFFFEYIYNFFMITLHTLSVLGVSGSGGGAAVGAVGAMPPAEAIAKGTLFANLDKMANSLLGCTPDGGVMSCRAIKGLVALIVAFFLTGGGFIISFMLMAGVITIFYAFIRFFVTFGTAIISLTFILMFTPIFVCFLLWKETADLFFNWLGLVVTYTLQPVIIIFFLSFISKILDFGAITTKLLDMNLIEDYNYGLPIVFWKEVAPTIASYRLKPGISLFSDVTVPNEIGGDMTMPLMVLIICYTIMWLAVAAAALGFLKMLPGFAMELSKMTKMGSNVPVIGGSQDGEETKLSGGKYIDQDGKQVRSADGMITPGFNTGLGGRKVAENRESLQEKLQRITGRKVGGALLSRAFRPRTVKRDSGTPPPTDDGPEIK